MNAHVGSAPQGVSATPAYVRRRPVILFTITSSDVGGTETTLRELAMRLDLRAFDPVVCSLCPPGRVAHEIAEAGIRVLTIGMSEQARVTELVAGAVKLARCIDEIGADLVQSFLYRANVLSALAAPLCRRRPVVVAGQRSLTPWSGRTAALAARWTRNLCDQVVAVSRAVRQELIVTEHLEPDHVVVIENGVDTSRYAASKCVQDDLGCEPGTVVVGGVGRLSREKGFHGLIDGVDLARRRGIPLSLVLAGDGLERGALEQRASALGLDGNVRFLGVRSDPRPVYGALDIFVLPSLEEGSPNALLEAMACGRAVVATRVGGVPEIIEHERSGLLVEPGSPPALAEAITRLAADPLLRQRLGQEAANCVRERFDIARMVERHAELYRSLLAERQSA